MPGGRHCRYYSRSKVRELDGQSLLWGVVSQSWVWYSNCSDGRHARATQIATSYPARDQEWSRKVGAGGGVEFGISTSRMPWSKLES